MDGFPSESLKITMSELEKEKQNLQNTISELNVVTDDYILTEEMLKEIIYKFKDFVINKDIPECKKFIQHYIERVIVHEDKVEVILKIASASFIPQTKPIPIYTAIISIKKLYKLFPTRRY